MNKSAGLNVNFNVTLPANGFCCRHSVLLTRERSDINRPCLFFFSRKLSGPQSPAKFFRRRTAETFLCVHYAEVTLASLRAFNN